jgi:hypothetical protein
VTTNTEQTTTPAWLNLDGFCPPQIRDQLAAATVSLEALLAYADPICREAYEASRDYDALAGKDAGHIDDMDTNLGHLTGYNRFFEAIDKLGAMLGAASGDKARGWADGELPAWYEEGPWVAAGEALRADMIRARTGAAQS